MTSQCLGLVSLMRQMSVTLPHLGYSHVLADQLELLQLYPAAAAGVTPSKQCLQPPSHLRYQPIRAQYYTS